jgi:hypothetical membrane protein
VLRLTVTISRRVAETRKVSDHRTGRRQRRRDAVKVLAIYVVLVIIGGFIAYEIGLYVERQTTSAISLIVFLALFFANFVIAWIIALRIVERPGKQSA